MRRSTVGEGTSAVKRNAGTKIVNISMTDNLSAEDI